MKEQSISLQQINDIIKPSVAQIYDYSSETIPNIILEFSEAMDKIEQMAAQTKELETMVDVIESMAVELRKLAWLGEVIMRNAEIISEVTKMANNGSTYEESRKKTDQINRLLAKIEPNSNPSSDEISKINEQLNRLFAKTDIAN